MTRLIDPTTGDSVSVSDDDAEVLGYQGYQDPDELATPPVPLTPEQEFGQSWQGSVVSGLSGVARGLSFGLSDVALNKFIENNPEAQARLQESQSANPGLSTAGDIAGGVAGALAAPAIGVGKLAAAGIRTLANAAEGGVREYAAAQRFDEPVAAERILQGVGIGALLGLGGEAVAAGISAAVPAFQKLGNKLLDKAAKYVPKGERAVNLDVISNTGTKAGKLPATMVGAFKEPFSTKTLAVTGAASIIPGVATVTGPALGAMAAVNRLPQMLNNREKINKYLTRIAEGPMQQLSQSVRGLIENVGQPLAIADVDSEYDEKAAVVEKMAVDPEGLNASLEERYGHVFKENPELWGAMLSRATTAAQILNEALPRSPHMPTAQVRPYNPPRAQKLKWLETYEAINNPIKALHYPTPTKIAAMEQVYPETIHLARNLLQGMLTSETAQNMPLSAARKVSVILGVPVRPETDPAFLARVGVNAQAVSQAPKAQSSLLSKTLGGESVSMATTNMQRMENR